MTDNTGQDPLEPTIRLHEDAFNPGYSMELGGQLFTASQWDMVTVYMAHKSSQAEAEAWELASIRGFHAGLNEANQLHKAQHLNRVFHSAMGIYTAPTPRAIPAEDVAVVIELIREEFIDELIPALGARVAFDEEGKFEYIEAGFETNVVEIYDALIDILYVTYGALNRAGMNAAPGYDEVQASNMSKLGEDGQPIIAQENDPDGIFPGRVKKGPNYFKPDLARVLRDQGWEG